MSKGSVVSPKLSTKSSWAKWLAGTHKEARRLGLNVHYANVLAGNPAGLPGGANAADREVQQRWRDFRDALENSLSGPALGFFETAGDGVTGPMNAGELVVYLRDIGHWGQGTMTEQALQNNEQKLVTFDSPGQPADISTFLSQRRAFLQSCPRLYSPDPNAAVGDNVNDHILTLCKSQWLSSAFQSTVDRLSEDLAADPAGLTFQTIVDKLSAKLSSLLASGEYKVESNTPAKAFASAETSGASKKRSGGADGGAFLSKSALKRIKKNAREEGRAEALAAAGEDYGSGAIFTTSGNFGKTKGGKGKGKSGKGGKGKKGGKPGKNVGPTCWGCGGAGHTQAVCPSNSQAWMAWPGQNFGFLPQQPAAFPVAQQQPSQFFFPQQQFSAPFQQQNSGPPVFAQQPSAAGSFTS